MNLKTMLKSMYIGPNYPKQWIFGVLNAGHCQGDPFKFSVNSLQRALFSKLVNVYFIVK